MLVPGRVAIAVVRPGHHPGAGQRVVDRRDLVAHDVRIALIEVNPLLEHGLIVLVERNAVVVVGMRPPHRARLDLEHVVAAVAVLIDPFADGVSRKGRVDFAGPAAAIGVDAAKFAHVIDANVGNVGSDDDLQRFVGNHHARHSRGHADGLRIVGFAA